MGGPILMPDHLLVVWGKTWTPVPKHHLLMWQVEWKTCAFLHKLFHTYFSSQSLRFSVHSWDCGFGKMERQCLLHGCRATQPTVYPKPHELKDLQLVPGFHFLHLVLLRQVLFSHLSTKLKQDRPLRLLFRCVVVLPVGPSCRKVHAVSKNLVDIHPISRKNVWVVFCTWHIERLWTLWLTNQNYLSTRAAKLATRNSCCRLFSGSLVSDLLVKLQAIHRVYLCPQHLLLTLSLSTQVYCRQFYSLPQNEKKNVSGDFFCNLLADSFDKLFYLLAFM